MGALTDNAKKAAMGYDSILQNGIFADHMGQFDEEYKGFPAKVLEKWMSQDPDVRFDVDVSEPKVFSDIAYRLKNYEYKHEERAAFQEFFARLIVLEATRGLCAKLGTDFMSAKVELYDTDVTHLISDLSMHILLKDKTIDEVERDMFYLAVVEQKPIAEIALEKKCSVATVGKIVDQLKNRAIEIQMELN